MVFDSCSEVGVKPETEKKALMAIVRKESMVKLNYAGSR